MSDLREKMLAECEREMAAEPIIGDFLKVAIIDQNTMSGSLAYVLVQRLKLMNLEVASQLTLFTSIFDLPDINVAFEADLLAVYDRDPACESLLQCLLFYKGFHALQCHRLAHQLWLQKRKTLAFTIQSQSSLVFGVDMHPAAKVGSGVMLDHATGLVVGETCTIGNNVSIMQGVTLGGTGKTVGLRHPQIRDGVLISAGAIILGNVVIGEGAKVGAGSVVLDHVPAHTTAVGVPARLVGHPQTAQPALEMEHRLSPAADSDEK